MRKPRIVLINNFVFILFSVSFQAHNAKVNLSLCDVTDDSAPILGTPILTALNMAKAHARVAKVKRNRARMHHHHHGLLRAENPLSTDDAPVVESARSTSNSNNKQDEKYFVWYLNNWTPYQQQHADSMMRNNEAIDNIYEYNSYAPKLDYSVELLARPSFYRDHDVVPTSDKIASLIPSNSNYDDGFKHPVISMYENDDNGNIDHNFQITPTSYDDSILPRSEFSRSNDDTPRLASPHWSHIKKWFALHSEPEATPAPPQHVVETFSSWKHEMPNPAYLVKPPTIVINNQNTAPQNMQVAQTSGSSSSSQSQAVSHNVDDHVAPRHFTNGGSSSQFMPTPFTSGQNLQIADTSGSSSSSQSQAVSHGADEHFAPAPFSGGQNVQIADTSESSSSSQSQGISHDVGGAPGHFANTGNGGHNIQNADTSSGSASHQSQSISGISAGDNMQTSFTTDNSHSSQSQSVSSKLRRPNIISVPHQRLHYRSKRSLPLVRLLTDPNAKLDMSKTLDNFGTVARNSFEDRRHPVYHVKNMAGSARDVFLSAMRIPPQGFVIPSQYRIIDTRRERVVPIDEHGNIVDNIVEKIEPIRQAVNDAVEPILAKSEPVTVKEKLIDRIARLRESMNNNQVPKVRTRSIFPNSRSSPTLRSPYRMTNTEPDYDDTFQKMGSMFRESIKSGQQTLGHLNDIAHSARKAFTTSTLGAPRVVRPLMRAPAIERTPLLPGRHRDPEKVTIIAPRFLDVSETTGMSRKTTKSDENFVGAGDIMNALGVSNPNEEKVGLRRYVIHSKVEEPEQEEEDPVIGSRFAEVEPSNDIIKQVPKRKFYVIAEDIDDNEVASEVDLIKELSDSLGVSSLKELLYGMKDEFVYLKDKIHKRKSKELEDLTAKLRKLEQEELILKQLQHDDRISSDEELDAFFKSIFTTPSPVVKSRSKRQLPHRPVGHGLNLPANLMKPFMGSPSKIEMHDFFRKYGDSIEESDDKDDTSDEILQRHQDQFVEAMFNPQEYLGAINPKMYEQYFHEPLKLNSSKVKSKTQFERSRFQEPLLQAASPVTHANNVNNELSTIGEINEAPVETFASQKPIPVKHFVQFDREVKGNSFGSSLNLDEEIEAAVKRFEQDRAHYDKEVIDPNQFDDENEDGKRISMDIPKKLLKPYMGKEKELHYQVYQSYLPKLTYMPGSQSTYENHQYSDEDYFEDDEDDED